MSNEYSSVAKRIIPSLYKYSLRGFNPVIRTYNLKSYFKLLIKCGLLMYFVIIDLSDISEIL